MGEQFERFARIAYFSKSSNIIQSNAQEIADLLGLQEAGRLNFNYPDKIATLFQTKLETQEYEQSMQALDRFYEQIDSVIQQGIDAQIVGYLSQRRDYSRRNMMSGLSGGRTSLRYKLQLSDHCESQFLTRVNGGGAIDWWMYFKPDFSQRYWHDIARIFIDSTQDTYARRIDWLCKNYHQRIMPLLKQAEFLHESSDGEQRTTARILRLPMIDNDTMTAGWMLLQHRPHDVIIKGHRYDQDHLSVQFYPHKAELIQHLIYEQESLVKQKQSLNSLLPLLSLSEDSFKLLTPDRRGEILTTLQRIAIGFNRADREIQRSVMGNGSWMIDRGIMQKISKMAQEQLYKNRIIREKNKLHINSLEAYSM